MDVYAEVEAGGRSFLLTHAGLDHFQPEKDLEDYALPDFLFGRAFAEQRFYEGEFLVFGHTRPPGRSTGSWGNRRWTT